MLKDSKWRKGLVPICFMCCFLTHLLHLSLWTLYFSHESESAVSFYHFGGKRKLLERCVQKVKWHLRICLSWNRVKLIDHMRSLFMLIYLFHSLLMQASTFSNFDCLCLLTLLLSLSLYPCACMWKQAKFSSLPWLKSSEMTLRWRCTVMQKWQIAQ